MALVNEDIRALTAPFAFEDHEFTRGFAYITEQAITRRLDLIDPGWQFTIIETVRDQTSATTVGRLIVCGVARDGVGTQSIEYSNTTDQATGEKKVATDAAGNPREAGEARKGAATDALKRAARLFGIGRYILDAPKLNMASNKPWETRLEPGSEKAFIDYLASCASLTWTKRQFDDIKIVAARSGVAVGDLPGLLGVQKISEYAPGYDRALELVRAHAAAKAGAK